MQKTDHHDHHFKNERVHFTYFTIQLEYALFLFECTQLSKYFIPIPYFGCCDAKKFQKLKKVYSQITDNVLRNM